MIKLYYAPLTRAIRVLWLLEELGLPYELARGEFQPTPTRFFQQATPTGKYPTIEDGEVVMCESGAIVEYILERYGEDRLAPPPGAPERAAYLQWMHHAEGTAYPPIGIIVWLTRYREGRDGESLLQAARERALSGLTYVERALGGRDYLLDTGFSAADIMMGFTVMAAKSVGLVDERFPALEAYVGRLTARPAFQKLIAAG